MKPEEIIATLEKFKSSAAALLAVFRDWQAGDAQETLANGHAVLLALAGDREYRGPQDHTLADRGMATREGLKRTSLAIAEAVESIGRRLAHSRGRLINAGYRDPALPNWVESEFAPDQIHDWLEPWFTKNDRPERQLIRWSDVAEGSLLRRYVTEDELPDVPTHGKCVVMPMNWRSKPWAILWLLKINASQVFEGLAEIYLKERERERQEKLAAEREARLRDPHERIRTLELRLQQMGVDFGDLAFVGPVVTTNTTTTRDFFGG